MLLQFGYVFILLTVPYTPILNSQHVLSTTTNQHYTVSVRTKYSLQFNVPKVDVNTECVSQAPRPRPAFMAWYNVVPLSASMQAVATAFRGWRLLINTISFYDAQNVSTSECESRNLCTINMEYEL